MSQIDSRGRVLWSGGKDGSVRWWGGKTAKVLKKSLICDGHVSVLKMDDEVVVAGYSRQGMEAWDVRTQQPLCTFSNAEFGGVQALQYDNRKIVAVSTTGKVSWNVSRRNRHFDKPSHLVGSIVEMVFATSISVIQSSRTVIGIRINLLRSSPVGSRNKMWQACTLCDVHIALDLGIQRWI